MYSQLLLVTILFLAAVLSAPFHDSSLNNGQVETSSDLSESRNALDISVAEKESPAATPQSKQTDDLIGQHTFYPVGGVWWGVRPWGGWNGYRPWHGWHGWHGWHRPHWGGPSWGGHWGGGGWGRTNS